MTYSSLLSRYRAVFPKGLGVMFLIQTISSLGFSIIYSTLVLYLTKRFHFSDANATGLMATFFAINYILHLLGGCLGGRFLSNRLLLAIGTTAQMLGCLFIAIGTLPWLYTGLATFVIGTGTSVTCLSCMITNLFTPDDERREAAFLINYSGMNAFYFLGYTISGYYQLGEAYRSLFLCGSVASFVTLLLIVASWGVLRDRESPLQALPAKQQWLRQAGTLAGLLFSVLLLQWLFAHASLTNSLTLFMGITMAFIIGWLTFRQPTVSARHKLMAYICLALATLTFLTLCQIAPMQLTLFISRNVDPHYLGLVIAPQWLRDVNALIVVVGAPLMTVAMQWARERGVPMTVPLQFSLALLLTGASFFLLPMGIHFANAAGFSSMNWIVWCYILQSIAELLIAPIGYALIGKLVPSHLQGLLMGTWLMMVGVASTLAWFISKLVMGDIPALDPLVSNPAYNSLFLSLGMMGVVAGFIMLLSVPRVLRLMGEAQDKEVVLTAAA